MIRSYSNTERPNCVENVRKWGLLLPPSANSFHRLRTPSTVCGLLPPLRRSPSLEEGGLCGGESGVGEMSAEIATVRCVCNAGLHHCNGWMHLQLSVALLSPVCFRSYSNNLSRGRAKGYRGDRKAPIFNRPQNRRFCRARNLMGNDCIACGLCGHALR